MRTLVLKYAPVVQAFALYIPTPAERAALERASTRLRARPCDPLDVATTAALLGMAHRPATA